MLAPGRNRPITRIQLKLSRRKPGSLSALIGHQSSGLLPTTNPKKPGGATPTMVKAVLLTVTCRPTTCGSEPKRRRQYSKLMTAPGWPLDRLSSASVSVRPNTGLPPSTEKKLPDTRCCSTDSATAPGSFTSSRARDDAGEGLSAVAEQFVERKIAVIAHA